MTWFKVDDGFYDHPKVLSLDMAARGLWVSAGAYCSRHLTDGVITDRQIRSIGGTRRQAEKLVAAGLWSHDGAPPNARRYAFDNWRDFQPTREEVEEKRAIDRQRKAEARARKADKQQEHENVRPDVRTESAGMSARKNLGIREMSALPDPTRPDPTNKREVVGQVTDRARDELSLPDFSNLDFSEAGSPDGGPSPHLPAYGTPDDPRCFEHKDLPRDQVRPCHKCAQAREHFQGQADAAKNARRAQIESCPHCDERGFIQIGEGYDAQLVKCDHTGHQNTPQARQEPFKPLTDTETRKRLLNHAKRHTDPF